jgi:MoxR-like ATPase
MDVVDARKQINKIIDNIETVIIGKRAQVELVIITLLSSGHILIEDVPGVGKTSLVSALSKSVDCSFQRIQFTPDVLPSDITGFSVFNQKTREFEFRPGAIMSNIILADEINRASAKTQSSLLEAMEEMQITVDANTYELQEPFIVLATENPLESFGTYPLPEAQIDRFMIKLSLGYPKFSEEVKIVEQGKASKAKISAVCTAKDIIALREAADGVKVSKAVLDYIVLIVSSTREHADIKVGSSPRGSIALASLSRAYALLQGRDFVLPDDVKYLAPYALAHRIIQSRESKQSGLTPVTIIEKIVSSVQVPIMED